MQPRERTGVKGVAGLTTLVVATVVAATIAARSGRAPVEVESEPLEPREAMASLVIQRGFRVQMAATEPMVQAPVCMNFDAAGRLIVLEMRSYMPDAVGSGEKVPTSRVVVLKDDDRNGRFEEAETFLDGLVLPRSVAPCRDGMLVLAPPDVLFCRDTDGDGLADEKRVLLTGLEGLTNPEHAPNALTYGLDNWWHLSQCGIEFRFDGKDVVTRATSAHGQWGMTMDDAGLLYYTPNSTALLGDLIPKHAAEMNPAQRGFGGVNEVVSSANTTWPVRKTPGVNRGYQENVLREDGTLASLTAACGPSSNRSGALGEELRGDFFICEPAGNLVKRLKRDRESATPKVVNAYENREFLASRDERFRPVWSCIGPDGALYIADMYRGVIQHKTYLSTYLRAQIIERKLELPLDFGRIYRVTADKPPRTVGPMPGAMTEAQLVATLTHEAGWWRDTAQRLLVERGIKSAAPSVRTLLKNNSYVTRLHALWTLEGLGEVTEADVLAMLDDSEPAVVRAALRVSESLPWSGTLASAVTERTGASDQITAAYAVLAAGPRTGDQRSEFLAGLLSRRVEQRPVRSAVVACSAGVELELIATMSTGIGKPGKGALSCVGELAECVVAGSDAARGELARLTADAVQRKNWVAAPLIAKWRGATRLDTSTPRVLTLDGEPTELLGVARENKEVAEFVRMLAWPGHIAEGQPAKPYEPTPAERGRFARGEQLYHNCVACHMKDGRGSPGQVPPLAGSLRVLGSPDPLVRILLHGLVGELEAGGQTYRGQMPATTITGDDDLASILTYIRGSFGNNAPPVHPEDVTRVREATKDRMRSWTALELEQYK